MRSLPTRASEKGRTFTVADFYEAGREKLRLELVAGEGGLGHLIEEPVVDRPGLALTGFYRHFVCKRLQLIGKAEMTYLKSLEPAVRRSRFRALMKRKCFCFIYTNGQKPSAAELAMAEEYGAVMFVSPLKTSMVAFLGTFLLEKLAAPAVSLYGTMVEVCGLGVLFEGDPGLGKSETALGLIRRGHALVADDLTCIRKDIGNSVLFGSAADSTAGYMEIRGIGIIHVPSVFGVTAVRGEKRLNLVVSFRRLKDVQGEIDRVGQTLRKKEILGVEIPNVVIPVSAGRDLVNLVETAAMQQKLLMSGMNPVRDLSERLRERALLAGKRTF